jgi:hypothetical protein
VIVAEYCSGKPELHKSPGARVEHGFGAELLHETAQFALTGCALGEIDEMHPYTSLGKKAQRLARVRALFYSEDLYVRRVHRNSPKPPRLATAGES